MPASVRIGRSFVARRAGGHRAAVMCDSASWAIAVRRGRRPQAPGPNARRPTRDAPNDARAAKTYDVEGPQALPRKAGRQGWVVVGGGEGGMDAREAEAMGGSARFQEPPSPSCKESTEPGSAIQKLIDANEEKIAMLDERIASMVADAASKSSASFRRKQQIRSLLDTWLPLPQSAEAPPARAGGESIPAAPRPSATLKRAAASPRQPSTSSGAAHRRVQNLAASIQETPYASRMPRPKPR